MPTKFKRVLDYDTGALYSVPFDAFDALIRNRRVLNVEPAPLDSSAIPISIPHPANMPIMAGAFSTSDTVKSVRMTREELEEIGQAAVRLSITPSMLIRWCAVWVAKKITQSGARNDTDTDRRDTTGRGE